MWTVALPSILNLLNTSLKDILAPFSTDVLVSKVSFARKSTNVVISQQKLPGTRSVFFKDLRTETKILPLVAGKLALNSRDIKSRPWITASELIRRASFPEGKSKVCHGKVNVSSGLLVGTTILHFLTTCGRNVGGSPEMRPLKSQD